MKKKFKSLFMSIFTTILTICSLTLLTSSAAGPATFDSTKDPNGDGQLTIADSAYIYQCLKGRYYTQNYSEFDVDNNGLVTEVDALLIQYYDAGVLE